MGYSHSASDSWVSKIFLPAQSQDSALSRRFLIYAVPELTWNLHLGRSYHAIVGNDASPAEQAGPDEVPLYYLGFLSAVRSGRRKSRVVTKAISIPH